jgi:glutamate-1-semialdehyde 2,1-aminomutase
MTILAEDTQINQSEALYHQAQKFIPGGVNSPVRAFGAVGGIPRFIQSAQGAYVRDVDGNSYIDYVGSWGAAILGHAHASVIAAVSAAAAEGLSFGMPSPREVVLAELICKLIPSVEKIRFVNSGTEAAMTAIRLARGYTGRNKILKFEGCYHGHADSLLVKAGSGALTFGQPSSAGVPEVAAADTLVASFNDIDSVAALFAANKGEIAAVIIEPIAANMNLILPKPNFLENLRVLCAEAGALLIFDEVITGFRVALQGAQGLYGIRPDLSIYGKIIGGGMPIGAVGGRSDIMGCLAPEGPVYQAGTLSGNPVAMSAGLATLQILQQPGFYEKIEGITQKLIQGMLQLAKQYHVPLFAHHVGSLMGVFFTSEECITSYQQAAQCDGMAFTKFFHNMLQRGVHFAPSRFEAGFVSIMHGSNEISKTLSVTEEVFAKSA